MRVVRPWGLVALVLASGVVLSGCDAANSFMGASPTPSAKPTGPVIVDLDTHAPSTQEAAGASASIIVQDGQLVWTDQKDSHGCMTTATDLNGKRRRGLVTTISMKATNSGTTSLQPWLLIETGGIPTPASAKGSALPAIKLRDRFVGVQGPVLAGGASETLSVTLILEVTTVSTKSMPAWTLYGGQGTKEELLAAYDTKQISSVVTGFIVPQC